MQQIETFHVGSFRGLEKLTLESMGQVNLIVGGNNSGKTSVLEALAVYASPFDAPEWANIARMREVRAGFLISQNAGLSILDGLRWLFPQRHSVFGDREPSSIFLAADGESPFRSISAEYISIVGIPPEQPYSPGTRRVVDEPMEEEGWHLSIDVTTDPHSVDIDALRIPITLADDSAHRQLIRLELDLWASTGVRYVVKRAAPALSCATLSPYSHRNQPMQLSRLSRIISSGQKPDLIALLRGIDPNLEDIEIITESSGRPLITALFRTGNRVPITVLGDGFRRALAIAVAMNQIKGGLLLIDEIETALHVSALDDLFPWLVRLAEQQNVQVFATTHSLEAIQAITVAAGKTGKDCVTAFHLPDRYDDQAQPRRYSTGMLERLVRDRGLDIR